MKKIWILLVTMVIANSFAAVSLLGYLVLTDRLDMNRLEKIRSMLTETIDDEEARLAAEEVQLQEELEAQNNGAPSGPPRTASELVAMRLEATDVDRQRIERLRREVEDLQRKLRRDQSVLDTRATDFKTQRKEFTAMRARLAEIEGRAQFRKSVGLINSLKPADSMALLDVLLKEGQEEQVVSYLDALEDRARSRIVAEFIKDGQQDLAAQLLESLRLRGLKAPTDGDFSNGTGN